MPDIDKNIYDSILLKIKNSDNLPERFKIDFFKFLSIEQGETSNV